MKADIFRFYVHLQRKAGFLMHNGHPKPFDPTLTPLLTCLLEEQEKKDILNVVESACNKAQGSNFMRGKFGKFINFVKAHYLF